MISYLIDIRQNNPDMQKYAKIILVSVHNMDQAINIHADIMEPTDGIDAKCPPFEYLQVVIWCAPFEYLHEMLSKLLN